MVECAYFVNKLLSELSRDLFNTLQICHRHNEVVHEEMPQFTVKIQKIGTLEIITIIVLQLEQLDFTVQHCVQKMQTE